PRRLPRHARRHRRAGGAPSARDGDGGHRSLRARAAHRPPSRSARRPAPPPPPAPRGGRARLPRRPRRAARRLSQPAAPRGPDEPTRPVVCYPFNPCWSPGSPQRPLDTRAALRASGPSLIIATRDADSVPEVCRCAAARVGTDGLIRLAVPLPEGERSIANATSTRVIALAATLPSTYHGIQIKG